MFAFNWLFGLGFWAAYIICGAVFCVIATKFIAPDTHEFISGRIKKDRHDNWRKNKDNERLEIFEIHIVILLNFIFWPFVLLVMSLTCLVILFSKNAMKLILLFIRGIAKKLPEISINKKPL